MDTRVTTIVAVVASGLLLAPVSAAFARDKHHSSEHHAVTRAAPQGQIACTQLGCERIPVSCTPVPGRTWRGTPTGYDVIVCPQR
jgi:hypothetical protein